MDRRDVLFTGIGTLAALTLTGQALAEEKPHQHDTPQAGNPLQKVIAAALDCRGEGEACLAHCLGLFAAGDTSLAACAISVSETVALCTALATAASLNSPRLQKLAAVCIDACEACEKECRKHEDKHASCKACADSCKRCIAACKALPA
ncbi:MAG: four-helix bundle copper-binding protein [Magnetococcales bacterium]|nr:four-helix bundle copper-binding protein [Magnetococcales bacterium]